MADYYVPNKEFRYWFTWKRWGNYYTNEPMDELDLGHIKITVTQGNEEVDVDYEVVNPKDWSGSNFSFIMKPQLSQGTTHTVDIKVYERQKSGEYVHRWTATKEFTKVDLLSSALTSMHITMHRTSRYCRVGGFLTGLGATGYTIGKLWNVENSSEGPLYEQSVPLEFPNFTTSTHMKFMMTVPYGIGAPPNGTGIDEPKKVQVMLINPTTRKYVMSEPIQLGDYVGYTVVGGFYPKMIYKNEKLLLLGDIATGTEESPGKIVQLPVSGTINLGKGQRTFSTSTIVNNHVAIELLDSEIPTTSTCSVSYTQDISGGMSSKTTSVCSVYEKRYNDPTADDIAIRQLSESEETGIIHKLYPLVLFPEGYILTSWEVYYGVLPLYGTPDYDNNTISFDPPPGTEKNSAFNVVHKLYYYRVDDGEEIVLEKSAQAQYSYDLPLNIIATDKYLYKRNGIYYTEDENGKLKSLGSITPDDMTFYDYGLYSYSEEHLTNGTTLVYYRAEPNQEIPKIAYKGTYQGCVVTMDWDVQSEQIRQFQLNGDIYQDDALRFLMSNDQGKTWLTFEGAEIKEARLSEIKTTGTTHEVWANLTESQIASLKGTSGLLRLAIYIERASVRAETNLKHIRFRY